MDVTYGNIYEMAIMSHTDSLVSIGLFKRFSYLFKEDIFDCSLSSQNKLSLYYQEKTIKKDSNIW